MPSQVPMVESVSGVEDKPLGVGEEEGFLGGGVWGTFFRAGEVAAGEDVGVRGLPVVGALSGAVKEFLGEKLVGGGRGGG